MAEEKVLIGATTIVVVVQADNGLDCRILHIDVFICELLKGAASPSLSWAANGVRVVEKGKVELEGLTEVLGDVEGIPIPTAFDGVVIGKRSKFEG